MPWPTLFFSAKESVYKAWFPLKKRWLDFTDAEVCFDSANETFVARLAAAAKPAADKDLTIVRGRFATNADHVMTAVVVPGR
jgi:4'-phosphopantetheinyl transferase EntD